MATKAKKTKKRRGIKIKKAARKVPRLRSLAFSSEGCERKHPKHPKQKKQ